MKKIVIGLLLCCPVWLQAQSDAATEKKIQRLINRMTLEEKCSLLHGNSKFYVSAIPRLGIPELALSDGPHGVRAEMNRHNWQYAGRTDDSSTCFPTGTAFAATWNPELAYERGIVLGDEARARGKDILLGPGVNIIRTPLCGRNFEYLSEDPYLNSRIAVAYIRGLQSRGVAASVKHYVANNQETDRTTVDVDMSERALREIYLPAFKAAVEEGKSLTVMGAYNKFRGDWCTENEYLGRRLLREEMGFDGIYMTDWDAAHSTVKAAKAGLDLEMGTSIEDYNRWYFAQPLAEAVRKGEIPESMVDEKVANVLRVMFRIGVFEPKKRNRGSINTPAHQQAAYRSAAEAIVLLKNDKNTLPLSTGKIKSIAVIGDNATRRHCSGGLSSEIKTLYEVTPLEALQNKLGGTHTLRYARGYEKQSQFFEGDPKGQLNTKNVDQGLIDEAVRIAAQSDAAVIFGGLNHDFDSESFDKTDMELPYGQYRLIQEVAKVNPNTIVVIIAGSPVELAPIAERVPAIVWGWFGGMEAGNAIAGVLTGEVNPSGKLPFTLPVSLGQSPAHALGNFPGKDLKVRYEEDILVGYRWFDTKNLTPQYPFGYGLSYTTFRLDKPVTDKKTYAASDTIRLRVRLTNSGERAGAEVVQVYASDPECSVMRPAKELKAFGKTALQPGESREIELNIPVSSLAFYDESRGDWNTEAGTYILQTGTSSRDILYTTEIEVK